MPIPINYLAVLAAGVASMVIGGLWYGPVFGKIWISLMGFTEEQMKAAKEKGVAKLYVINFIASLVMAFVLAHNAFAWESAGAGGALQLAFWTWLGFIVPVMLGSVLWEGKKVKLFVLNAAYYLVSVCAMALVLVWWK